MVVDAGRDSAQPICKDVGETCSDSLDCVMFRCTCSDGGSTSGEETMRCWNGVCSDEKDDCDFICGSPGSSVAVRAGWADSRCTDAAAK